VNVDGIAKKLREARERRGLARDEVAQAAGLTPSMYWDLEMFDDELVSVVSAKEASAVCKALNLDLRELLALGDHTLAADRSKAIAAARVERDLSQEELADAIGYYPWVIKDAEATSDGVDGLCLIAILELETVLGLRKGALVPS
jgi:transcriptional regulator with XRE-family HTH domain